MWLQAASSARSWAAASCLLLGGSGSVSDPTMKKEPDVTFKSGISESFVYEDYCDRLIEVPPRRKEPDVTFLRGIC